MGYDIGWRGTLGLDLSLGFLDYIKGGGRRGKLLEGFDSYFTEIVWVVVRKYDLGKF